MQEFAAIRSILETALRRAGTGRRITDVYLVIGDLSGVAEDSVRSYWERLAGGTPAQGARLHFRRIPAQVSCMVCRRHFVPRVDDLVCPYCGSRGVKVEQGEEFYVEAVEVEKSLISSAQQTTFGLSK